MNVLQPTDFRSDRSRRRSSRASKDLGRVDEVAITVTGSNPPSSTYAARPPSKSDATSFQSRHSFSQMRNIHSHRLRQSVAEYDYEGDNNSRASSSSEMLDRQIRQLSLASAPEIERRTSTAQIPREARACSLSTLQTEAERDWSEAKQARRPRLVQACLQESSDSRRWSLQPEEVEKTAEESTDTRRRSLFERRDVSGPAKLLMSSPRRDSKMSPAKSDKTDDDGKLGVATSKEQKISPKSPRRDLFSMFRPSEEMRTRSMRAESVGAAEDATMPHARVRSPSVVQADTAGPSRQPAARRLSMSSRRKSSIASQMRRMYAPEKADAAAEPMPSTSEADISPPSVIDTDQTTSAASSDYFPSSPSLLATSSSDTDASESPDEMPKFKRLVPSFSDPFNLIQQQPLLVRKQKSSTRPYILASTPSASTRRGSNYIQSSTFAPETLSEANLEV